VETVRERNIPCVQGNHDRKVAQGTTFVHNPMARAGVSLATSALSEGAIQWLRELPHERRLLDDRLTIVHGHPDDPDRYTYPAEYTPEMLRGEDVLVMGHTHVQHVERFQEGIVMNPGSVGQPRDGDPRAAYAVLDLDTLDVEAHRVEYDVDRVIEAIQEAGLLDQTGRRLRDGR
jgi:putative phosphoesterase